MKKILFCLTIVLLSVKSMYATDLVVEEFGITPAYPTITDAITAASNGDRIIIKNRAGNIPWIENISVTKSLTFLPYDNDTFFVTQGSWTINLNAGQVVTIIGMKNTSGGISSSSNPTTNKSAAINIHGCYLLSGSVNIPNSGYEVNVTHTQLDAGYIQACFGSVIGCEIMSLYNDGISFNSGSVVLTDTVFVIGNKVTTGAYNGIYLNTTTSRFHVKNNFVRSRYMGIRISNACNGANLVYNNTIQTYSSSNTCYSIDVYQVSTGDILEVMNNVCDFLSSGSTYGVNNDGGNNGTVNVYFNHIDNANYAVSAGFTFSGNNTTTSAISLAGDGRINAGSAAINGANPAAQFYDLDLTTGDAGAYGGSYTLDNYFPLFNGAARVYLNTYPFNVRSGNTLNIKANSFDR